jgi:hypothetical protein
VAVAVACGLAIVACHADFYRLCLRKRGLLFAVGAGALHVLFFVYSSLTFGMVAVTTCLPWPAGQPAVARDAA